MSTPKDVIQAALKELSGTYAALCLMLEKKSARKSSLHEISIKLQRAAKILEDYVNET